MDETSDPLLTDFSIFVLKSQDSRHCATIVIWINNVEMKLALVYSVTCEYRTVPGPIRSSGFQGLVHFRMYGLVVGHLRHQLHEAPISPHVLIRYRDS